MAFPPEFLDEVRRRLPVSAVVGARVKLTKKGREWSGLCPFHTEKSPSFFVNDDKGFYKCFGCGKSGDQITFAMETEGLSFPEAVASLAERAGLEVPQDRPVDPQAQARRKRAEDALEIACLYYEAQLAAPAGADALAYLSRRGLTRAEVGTFRLGWAPEGRGSLKAHLAKHGVPEAASVEAGVLKQGEDGAVFDFFRGRVMFPIFDRRGRPIGFGGRVLGDGQPKYLNSSDGPLFHKGRTLYALHLAREAAAKKQPVIVTEGYMDVIALNRAGFGGAVAPLGTALTEDQLQELWRLSSQPIICLDGDAAGQRAAARAAQRALALVGPERTLSFVTLPAGQDPDDLIRASGAAGFSQLLAAAVPLVDQIWRMATAERAIATPEQRAALQAELRGQVRTIADPATRSLYDQEINRRLNQLFGTDERARPDRARGQWVREPTDLRQILRRRAALQAGTLRKTGRPTAKPAALDDRLVVYWLTRFPRLIDLRREELALTEFADPTLDQIRATLVGIDIDSETTSADVEAGLAASGLDLSVLTALNLTPAFVRAVQTLNEQAALERVDAMLAAQAISQLRQDIADAQNRFIDDQDPATWSRIQELQALVSASVEFIDTALMDP